MYFAGKIRARSILDYGAGQQTLSKAFWEHKGRVPSIHSFDDYDPSIPKIGLTPYPKTDQYDLVTCTDVLEHIEPDKLDNVLKHLFQIAYKGAFLVIANRLSNKIMKDGRNSHLIIEPDVWWINRIEAVIEHPQNIRHYPINDGEFILEVTW